MGCKVDDCANKIIKARGFCSKHYARWRRRGSPDIVFTNADRKPKYSSLKESLESGYAAVDIDECWEWTKSFSHFGYGQLWWIDRHILVHRASYISYVGEIPEGMCVLHKCDNPKCLNPNHLFLGSRLDNNQDRAKKRRSFDIKGEGNPFSKLSDANVIDIKNRLRKKERSIDLASEYKVCVDTIYKIKAGINWSHIA